jgi:hypothetical protein
MIVLAVAFYIVFGPLSTSWTAQSRPSWSCGGRGRRFRGPLAQPQSCPLATTGVEASRWYLPLLHTQVYDHPIAGMSLNGRRRLREDIRVPPKVR